MCLREAAAAVLAARWLHFDSLLMLLPMVLEEQWLVVVHAAG